MMEVFWFIIIVACLALGMYQSAKYARRAEKKEQGQGEYRYYLYTTALWWTITIVGSLYAKQLGFSPALIGAILAVVVLVLWFVLGSGKTYKAAMFAGLLTLVVLVLSGKLLLPWLT